MPSLDHCINNPPEMTTLTNTLEVFDTYKHREDKDSDEESFHLPLDDDELDTKLQEPITNGCKETEEEILDKFDTPVTLGHVDSQLEESLLHEDEEEKKGIQLETSSTTDPKLTENGEHSNKKYEDGCSTDIKEKNEGSFKTHFENGKISQREESSKKGLTDEKVTKEVDNIIVNRDEPIKDGTAENKDVPKVENSLSGVEVSSAIKTGDKSNAHLPFNNSLESCKLDKKTFNEQLSVDSSGIMESVGQDESSEGQVKSNSTNGESEFEHNSPLVHEDSSNDKPVEKNENSNDSTKHHNEDSEDLFDISIIRDAEEDNAENAYNEAHAEENEDYDDRNDDKMEDDSSHEKTNNMEELEDEEMDIDKHDHDDHLKNDDVEIEEANLKLDCDGIKDTVSDGESESNKTESVDIINKQKTSNKVTCIENSGVRVCRLDEVTGKLMDVDTVEVNVKDTNNVRSSLEKRADEDKDDGQGKKSLKRGLSDDGETGTPKKTRTEADVEIKEVEKPKEKLPLRTLVSLSDFMKTKRNNKRLNMHDLEEFCIQKMCEVIVHKSDLGDVHHQLKLQEQLIETMRKEIQQLTKQARDLEIVNKKLMNDLKQQTTTQKPLNPLKITRSVGLQVKFTPAFEANMKRRQQNAAVPNQKTSVQATPNTNRSPRMVTNAVGATNRQVVSPQKQQQTLPKPNTPLLSQALQNRRNNTVSDTNNKVVNQVARPKPVDQKSGTPSASVIDLTDEDDKKDKNKNTPQKMVPPKNVTVPLRTPMRVNATAQGLRLTTSQGKVSPITSVVTSSAPQVMYVVQSSPQNVLTSALGSKAVVVNFQSANGVLTSALNGSAVSVIPKQTNTIQLKTVAAPKTLQNNKVLKITSKHPAPLPSPPVVRTNLDKPLKPIPPKPHLTIRKTDTGIILQWKMPYELDMYEVIASYQLYAYQETSALPSTDMWRKVGDVKALALPMACTLTQFADKNKYYFAVRPVDIHKRIGMFSEPEEISL